MVDKWPQAQTEQSGIAALAPQFDEEVHLSRRSAQPIGTLSPQTLPSPWPQTLTPSPSAPAHDFFAESTASQHSDFDLFGLANLDLGPPVFSPTVSNPAPSLSPPPPPPPPQPSSAPLTPRRELPHPTRCLLLRNIPPAVDDDDIRRLLLHYGPLRELGAQQRSRGGRGSVLATFFDLRHARTALRALDGTVQFGRRLEVRFQCPPDAHVAPQSGAGVNQGTLVVFNLDTATSAEDIRALFSTIGDVKEIRATPNKKHHKFVEFYDIRDAEKAMHLLNKTEVSGKRIKIEISRPGGRASNIARHIASQKTRHNHVPYAERSPPSHHHLLSPSRRVHSPTSVPIGATNPSASAPSFDHHLSALSIPPTSSFDAATSIQPALYDRSFRSDSLNLPQVDFDDTPLSTPLLSSDTPSSVPTPLPVAPLRHLYSDVPVPDVPRFNNSTTASAHTPTDSYIRALYSSPDDGCTTTSPIASPAPAPFAAADADLPPNNSADENLFKSFAAADDPSPGDTFAAANLLSHRQSPTQLQGKQLAPAVAAAVTPTTGGYRSFAPKQQSSKPVNTHAGSSQAGSSKTFFSGQQQSQQQQPANTKYALDIRKVRSGEETRTALMIRNIPNKYNQKMLLSTLEEAHRGHFDFIYLPIDFKNKCNVGYAFINFTKPQYIEPFYNAFHGKKWGRFNSEKVCEITFARIQGRQQLIAHFQNSSLLLEDPKCRPVIFDAKGRQEEFPIGSHVRTRRGPSNRDSAHRTTESSPPYSPTRNRGRA